MPLYAGELNLRRGAPLGEYPAPLSSVLRSQMEQTRHESPTRALFRLNDLAVADRGELVDMGDPESGRLPEYIAPRMLDAATARTRVADEGLQLLIPQDGIAEPVLDILIKRKREELRRQDVMSRGPDGVGAGAARLGVALVESLFDPLNIASAFIPVVGPARYARMVGQAGGAMGRAGVRASVGAVEGAAGAVILEPLIYAAAQAEQADYTMADSLLNVAFGGVFGGGLHVVGGAAADVIRRNATRAIPEGHQPSDAAAVAHRVSPETRQAAARVSVAQAAEGRVIDVEPVIRSDTVTAYHGSPHDFDKFTLSRETMGTGEGHQSYGKGLYFSDDPKVAEQYARGVGREIENGVSYRVEIPNEAVGRMLDWEKPLGEQTEAVQKAISLGIAKDAERAWEQIGVFPPFRNGARDYSIDPRTITGRAYFKLLGPEESATESLRARGIVGTTHRDQTGAGREGARNFVLFDESLARIVEKNGVTVEEARAAAQRNAQSVRSAEPEASAAARTETAGIKPDDLKAAESELEQAMNAMDEIADALGVDRATVQKALSEHDAAIKRAGEYAKALKAGAACGVA